jgi:hypothetical protein
MEEGQTDDLAFTITNTGNGPLDWHLNRKLPGDANADPWQLRRQYSMSDSTGDPRLHGVYFIEDHFYVTGSNDNDPQIYVFNREGELLRQFAQHNNSVYGMKDLAWDGEWLWGSGENHMKAFNREGELMRSFIGPFTPNTLLTWDSENQWFWVSGITTHIMAVDREGNEMARINRVG